MNKIDRIKELIEILNRAAKAYYQESRELMSNLEYDALYDELCELEKETGIVYGNSPTVNVGYELLSELPKEAHESPMLSLDKTKEPEVLRSWLNGKEAILSWKLDGLTIVLTYKEGKLFKAVTRGNGEIGEVITNNARTFANIPSAIPFKGELVIRGEAVIRYSDFEKINASIEDVDAKYKNPRNLCSGSVRQLNNEITAKRNVNFYAFNLVKAEGRESVSVEADFNWLLEQGFDVVEYKKVTSDNIVETISWFADRITDEKNSMDLPSDGLVLTFDDIVYGRSLGRTAKFPRNAIAFKWADELAATRLLEVEWSPSRTGLINPVAIFEPVELEGTTVSRASLHNISILEGLELGIGDEISVYKANMIIPQVAENFTKTGDMVYPEHCPACGGATEIRMTNDVKALYCTNPLCSAKKIKLFSHFVSRDAMNVDGLSEATLDKMIEKGFLKELPDLFHLSDYAEEIKEMEGFGQKSCDNLLASIDKSRKVIMPNFIFSLGILNIGLANAKLICKEFNYDLERIRKASVEELTAIGGIGEVIAKTMMDYFSNEHNSEILDLLLKEVDLQIPETTAAEGSQSLVGKVFVVTGSVNHFKNRKELQAKIEELGGKVTGSVTGKTDYLINNDNTSSSSKNKKAKELNIPIITEEEFLRMIENFA
ncbi:MAG: NAD-dependent DNA ligase LigA [Lachnospiraceae bacterium]|nr:NAD-dependent DNA ligase LigA [Lachnospiraceae bacterium]